MDPVKSRTEKSGQSKSGQKRPAASLLPAFEPLSSSPSLPRPLKRTREALANTKEYPTPVPSSSTLVPSSSPPRELSKQDTPSRAKSTGSERAPLSSVPTVQLPNDGKVVRLGRSTVSCQYQLSSHIMVSRVHIEARISLPDTVEGKEELEICCTGWNGATVRCHGEAYKLSKGTTFTSDQQAGDIVIAVHDSSVILKWPAMTRKKSSMSDSSSASEEDNSPTRRKATRRQSAPSSPIQQRQRVTSPVSPSPAAKAATLAASPLPSAQNIVFVYEDETAADASEITKSVAISQSTQSASQRAESKLDQSLNSSLSEAQDFSDNDEENDPIIMSFGPQGANLLPRMESINAQDSVTNSPRSPRRSHAKPLKATDSPSQPKAKPFDFDTQAHIINQLAFSRLASTPLSTILAHLPHESRELPVGEVKHILSSTSCIGEVARAGKDAAGKALESEFYYIPDEDEDAKRKEAVVNDLMKPPLRSCRKQHKVM
ncbi:MAG: hypothetical protein Q9160_007576 [Pyrenula sp. 1 TL-2023]